MASAFSAAAQAIPEDEEQQLPLDEHDDAPPAAAPQDQWPRTWQDASQWTARAPSVAQSLHDSFWRTRHPEVLEYEQLARSPTLLARAHTQARGHMHAVIDELEEALLASPHAGAAPSGAPALTQQVSLRARPSPLGRTLTRTATAARSIAVRTAGGETETVMMCVEEEFATSNTWQAGFNAVNILCGVGLLTTPYALAISGTSALLLLIGIGAIACYTGRLLAKIMDSGKAIRTYPDIGGAAFGHGGRLLVSVLLYLELFCCVVDFLILEGDNLSAVFPGASLNLLGWQLTAKQTLILAAGLVVLPTVWLRDMSLLSYLSVGGIFASVAILGLVGWLGIATTGFTHTSAPLVTWPGIPVSLGLFCFCFSGHAVFPSLYASMRTKSHFSYLLVGSFAVVVALYGTMAVMGALMFGSDVSENITLDMQDTAPRALPTIVSMWLVIVNPIAKIALMIAPVAMALEELLSVPHGSWAFTAASLGLRTALLAATVLVAMVVPFFSAVMSFIGAFMSMSISIILPCVFFMKVCRKELTVVDVVASVSIAVFGAVAGTAATYHAITGIADKY